MRKTLFFLLLGLFVPNKTVHSQLHGKLLIKNYDQLDIGSEIGAFWAVVRDQRGILYFGGEGAVFEFDGLSWRNIPVPNHSAVRSLAIGENGLVYVGAVGEFGYLIPDEKGEMFYQTLLPKVPKNKLLFPDVWSVNVVGNDVYFQSENRLFCYRNDKIITWELKNSYHRAFAEKNTIFFNQRNIGLCYLHNDSIKILPNGGFFKDKTISSITHYVGNKVLIGTRSNGLFVTELSIDKNASITPWNSEANQYIKRNRLYHGINLSDEQFAFATLQGGVIITNSKGNIIRYISKPSGLIDYTTYFINVFNEKELWITTAKGVSFYNINSAISYWNDELGIKGPVSSILIKDDIIYAGTQSGLFYLDRRGRSDFREHILSSFKLYDNQSTEVWDIIEFDLSSVKEAKQPLILASTGKGLYNLKEKRIEFPNKNNGELTIYQSKKDPTILYYSTHPTFYVLKYINNKWKVLWKKNITSYVLSVVEDANGDVWIGTRYYGLYKLNLSDYFVRSKSPGIVEPQEIRELKIEHYHTLSGLPNINACIPHVYKNKLVVSCNGLFSFDEASQTFVRSNVFGEDIKAWNETLYDFKEDRYGNIWGLESEVLDKQPDGSYKVARLPYQMLSVKNSTTVYFHEENGLTWIGGEQGLFMYNSKSLVPFHNVDFKTFIRQVRTSPDSTVFMGANYSQATQLAKEGGQKYVPEFGIKTKTIKFSYACPYFQDDIPLEYSYYLEGYESKWSEWSSSTLKEYNNLREKSYGFHVRARNYQGNISKEAVYKFVVKPPWYRSIFAYVVYVVLFGLFFYGSIKLNSMRLKQNNITLEKTVKERTLLLEQQKEEINGQAEQLRLQNEKLIHQRNRMSEMSKELSETNKYKMQFFTNISHELRTPLTLIIGPTEELLKNGAKLTYEERNNHYSIIHRNANRLLNLVNQILDFRKIEIQSQKLSAIEGDIVATVKEVASYFKDVALKQDFNYFFRPEEPRIITWFDVDSIEKIVFNLISNAFKYTPEHGQIEVGVGLTDDKLLEDQEGKLVVISVKDNGIGIPKKNLSKIFDRFYQTGQSLSLEQAGSGIGLSLCMKLAELHHGRIIFESTENVGSIFTLAIPFGKDFLSENEVSVQQGEPEKPKLLNVPKGDVIQLNTQQKNLNEEFSRDPNKRLIMLVEDSGDIRQFIRQSLAAKYDFIEAENGEEGITLAKEHFPDLIISDVMMPKIDGYEFCERIRKTVETAHIPIIMLTSKTGVSAQKLGLEKGADDYITKPFNIELLDVRVQNLIKSRIELRERFRKEIVVKPTDVVISSTDEKFLNKAISTVEEHISELHYDIEQFSRDMAMSQSTLYRKLKALTGESTNNFMKEMRLNRAASLLLQDEISVSEIANMVGFDAPAYFSKSFKQKFGVAPSEYSKTQKE